MYSHEDTRTPGRRKAGPPVPMDLFASERPLLPPGTIAPVAPGGYCAPGAPAGTTGPLVPPGTQTLGLPATTRHHPGTRVRRGDPETSRAVAGGVAGDRARLSWRQEVVYEAIRAAGGEGLTDEELTLRVSAVVGPGSTARTRRSELVEAGRVRWSGSTRTMSTGNKARIWVTADPGQGAGEGTS